ncbi:MAG TPA: chemotaxis protein CheA [Opitutaceae bacterium]|nr:chemotaxis protein CheA [Opitutaceae bacterium]
MPIPLETFPPIEDTLNRLAAESVLAQIGRDEGLIPAYSLLGELTELTGAEPQLVAPLQAMRTKLEKRLDNAMPFDEATLGALRAIVGWLPGAVAAAKIGQPIPACTTAVKTATPFNSATAAAEAAAVNSSLDVVQSLNLEENRELLGEFRSEAIDHLSQIEAALLILDEKPDDKDALDSLFRSFHTIKGVSGFLHLRSMHVLTHDVESLLDLARNGELRLNPTIVTAILQSRDAVQAMMQQITLALEKGILPSEVIPVSHLISQVKALVAGAGAKSPAAPAPAKPAVPAPQPAPAPVWATTSPFEQEAAFDSPAIPKPPVAAPAAPAAVPPLEQAKAAVAAAAAAIGQTKVAAAAPVSKAGSAGATAASTVRVNTEKLDVLMDVVGELVIVQSQLIESARPVAEDGSPLHRNVIQLGRITKELQHNAMSLRMVPVKPTFQKMERLARDLARDFGKKVTFVTSGEETEVDRTVVEEIADPLIHMVRNSMDHGVEPPSERLAKGKAEFGTIELKAYHQGSNIIIELRDDGRGIDPEKILARAVKLKLVPEGESHTREEILNYIFLPGFSTAEKVTAVSGRGVGMDVVKRNIDKLRGKVEINSEVGKGTIFRIKLPLTMAIIDGLVVRVGAERFILPSTSVQMALRPTKEAFTTVHGRGEVLDHRGRILSLHRLHRRFGISGAIETPWEGIVVIMEANGRVSALLVDEMVNKQEVVIKNLGAFLHGLVGVAGGAILGDGNIALILDPASLFETAPGGKS